MQNKIKCEADVKKLIHFNFPYYETSVEITHQDVKTTYRFGKTDTYTCTGVGKFVAFALWCQQNYELVGLTFDAFDDKTVVKALDAFTYQMVSNQLQPAALSGIQLQEDVTLSCENEFIWGLSVLHALCAQGKTVCREHPEFDQDHYVKLINVLLGLKDIE